MTAVLEVAHLTVRYGGVVAVDDVSLAVDEGEVVGVIGPNGAGKTTLIDAVTGFVEYEGSVSVAGRRVDGFRPDQRAAAGLARSFQTLELFDDLTVRENVAVGARGSEAAVASALARTGIADVAGELPDALRPSTRRFVALARALAGRPRLLLLDEVAAGMDREERATLVMCLRHVVNEGAGVLIVDHDLGLVAELCPRVVVLGAGRVIASGAPAEVRREEQVLAAYLGRRS